MFRIRYTLATIAAVALVGAVSAQENDLAYVPRTAPERTADDVAIDLRDTQEPGVVDLVLPQGSYQVDLLNANGNVVKELAIEGNAQLDLRNLRAGTWTIRAHSPRGRHVRRFVVLGGGNMWIDTKKPVRR